MIPNLNFTYSVTYDQQWTLALGKNFSPEKNREIYREFIKQLRKDWNEKVEDQALKLISKYSGLTWNSNKIDIYCVNNLNISGFSKPFTIKMDDDTFHISHVVIHELIHALFHQNSEIIKKVMGKLRQKFKSENDNTLVHILVIPLEKKVFTEIFGNEKYEIAYNQTINYKGFKKVYDIIEKNKINDLFLKSNI